MPVSSRRRGAAPSWPCCRHLVEIDKLNGMRPGVTVNIGRIEGGTQPNVVAEYARAEVDLRAWRNDHIPPLLDAIRAQLQQPVVPGVTATLERNPRKCHAGHGAHAGRGTPGGAGANDCAETRL